MVRIVCVMVGDAGRRFSVSMMGTDDGDEDNR